MTSSEMNDIWVHEIGPKLCVQDIVQISAVSRWGRSISHSIIKHPQYVEVYNFEVCEKVAQDWPCLRLHLQLFHWLQTPLSQPLKPSSLALWMCDVFSFEFFDPTRLEALAIHSPTSVLNTATIDSLSSSLAKCSSLVSLELTGWIEEGSDVTWLANILFNFPRMLFLDLCCNALGSKRFQTLKKAISRMVRLVTLNVSLNDLEFSGVSHVCDCIQNMPNLTALNIEVNSMGWQGANILRTVLANARKLTSLNIMENNIPNEEIRDLATCLSYLPSLTYFNIKENEFDHVTKEFVQQRLSHVIELEL
eukprot:c13133_g10_i2.p1 GENE.c13133_g10_i2~~c13133_g10_i2.p1  ORF type:complete len:337 (+),score=86.04 c13133_g10_i2:93-1013(+)